MQAGTFERLFATFAGTRSSCHFDRRDDKLAGQYFSTVKVETEKGRVDFAILGCSVFYQTQGFSDQFE